MTPARRAYVHAKYMLSAAENYERSAAGDYEHTVKWRVIDDGWRFSRLAEWRLHFELEAVECVRALAEMAGEP